MESLPSLRVGLQCTDGSRERDVICLWGEKKDLVVLVELAVCFVEQ